VAQPTEASRDDAAPDEDGRDALAVFLASDNLVLDKLFASILRRIPDDQGGAEDVYTTTLYAFVAYADRKQVPEHEYVPLVYRIAQRKIADYWRVRSRRGSTVLTEPSNMGLLTDAFIDPYADADRRIDVARAVHQLTEQQQRALVLVYVDRFTHAEVGTAMGISASAVKKLLVRATTNLLMHGLLDGHGIHATTTLRTTEAGASEAQAGASEAQA
jgi:RNA polymerase sigma factor (sigma-70 family)